MPAFAERAAAAGHEYRETPSTGHLVDASCLCAGWSRWDVGHDAALVAWRVHASPAIMSHEGGEA